MFGGAGFGFPCFSIFSQHSVAPRSLVGQGRDASKVMDRAAKAATEAGNRLSALRGLRGLSGLLCASLLQIKGLRAVPRIRLQAAVCRIREGLRPLFLCLALNHD